MDYSFWLEVAVRTSSLGRSVQEQPLYKWELRISYAAAIKQDLQRHKVNRTALRTVFGLGSVGGNPEHCELE